MAVEVALGVNTMTVADKSIVRGSLDTFDERVVAQTAAEFDHALQERAAAMVWGIEFREKGAVEFDDINRQFGEVSQIAVTRTEVVHGDADAALP